MLLELNSNVNKIEDGTAPLFQAAENGHIVVCTVLLKNNLSTRKQ